MASNKDAIRLLISGWRLNRLISSSSLIRVCSISHRFLFQWADFNAHHFESHPKLIAQLSKDAGIQLGKNLYVDIKKDASHLRIIIRDDGKGFDVNNYTSKNGNGIKNMRFRAEEVKAKYQIESSPAGTVTTITV